MAIAKERFNPKPENVALIESISAKLLDCDSPLKTWISNYTKSQKNRLAFDLEMLSKFVEQDTKILEVGSAPFLLTGALKNTGYDITGIDVFPERMKPAIDELDLNILKCDIETETIPVSDASFKVVILNEVFEHMRVNLIFTMQEIYRVLSPGGYLFLSTPNLLSLRGIINLLCNKKSFSSSIYKEYEKLMVLGHMGHVREYTSREIEEFLEDIGFEVKEVIYRGRYYRKSQQLLISVFPSLRPFFSIIASKPYCS